MTDERYIMIQHQLLTLAGLVRDFELEAFLNRISMAETIGPIVDPTLYRDAMHNLDLVKDLAESLLPFARAARRVAAQDGMSARATVKGAANEK